MPTPRAIEIVSAIHKKIREQRASCDTETIAEDWANDLTRLHSAYNNVYTSRNLVGKIPQMPNLLLAKMAGLLIRAAQTLLFWYTPQIRQFHESATGALEKLTHLEDREFHAFLSLSDRVRQLENELRLWKLAAVKDTPTAPAPPQEAPLLQDGVNADQFYFALQGRFQSNDSKDRARLEMYRSLIQNLEPTPPAGTWLDIGCGRGQWLRVAAAAGHRGLGVDANEQAVAECRGAGLDVEQADALAWLRRSPDQSFSVITAFHVLEHWPFEYTLNFVYQAARTLLPDGILLVETPNPANLLMASEQFWLDPTHRRPVPIRLMEFLFEYCGLRIAHRLELSPRPEEERLPLAEFEVVSRLNDLFYGPQDYGLMGQV
jgi:2-polyprenyl-3-methyl-5-hydroxy-6-metoxy-1,4-benzoquinol methylase